MIILNAFSLSMIPLLTEGDDENLRIRLLTLDQAREMARDAVSFVGHASTARIFSTLLGRPVDVRRESVRVSPGMPALVGQYRGPRLEEGATELPEGAGIDWIRVEVVPSPVPSQEEADFPASALGRSIADLARMGRIPSHWPRAAAPALESRHELGDFWYLDPCDVDEDWPEPGWYVVTGPWRDIGGMDYEASYCHVPCGW